MPLDPRDSSTAGVWTPSATIPPALAAFGRFPNTHDWLPGDLLLFDALHRSVVQRRIVSAQTKAGYAPNHARWTHAAVYIGENTICEAVTTGVRVTFLYDVIGPYVIKSMRDGTLSVDERYRLAIQAVVRLKSAYGFGTIGSLFRRANAGFWRSMAPAIPRRHQACICSELYAEAYAVVTNRLVVPLGNGPVATPAALSASAHLFEVPTYWRTLAPR